jgi:hypothetical protein
MGSSSLSEDSVRLNLWTKGRHARTSPDLFSLRSLAGLATIPLPGIDVPFHSKCKSAHREATSQHSLH